MPGTYRYCLGVASDEELENARQAARLAEANGFPQWRDALIGGWVHDTVRAMRGVGLDEPLYVSDHGAVARLALHRAGQLLDT